MSKQHTCCKLRGHFHEWVHDTGGLGLLVEGKGARDEDHNDQDNAQVELQTP